MVELYSGDCIEIMRGMESGIVQTCVTSPPYFHQRDYGIEGQIGLEKNPSQYVEKLTEVFREVRRLLRDDGTLWLNLGDKFRNKQLLGIPWRVAFALQDDGWYIRSEIIWNKSDAMPESVKDRPTTSHEHIFLLSKYPKYYYDTRAAKEPSKTGFRRTRKRQNGLSTEQEKKGDYGFSSCGISDVRNLRSVWQTTTQHYKGAHFATFPPSLIEPCILIGSAVGDIVLDPFSGAATTGLVSLRHGRRYIGIDLNPEYNRLAEDRLTK